MTLTSPIFLQKDISPSQKPANDLTRFWISKMPAGLSPIQKRVILFPIKKEVLVSLLADCEENNPEVFADTHGMSFRPVFVGDIAQAEKFDLELQPVKRPDNSVGITFLYISDLD